MPTDSLFLCKFLQINEPCVIFILTEERHSHIFARFCTYSQLIAVSLKASVIRCDYTQVQFFKIDLPVDESSGESIPDRIGYVTSHKFHRQSTLIQHRVEVSFSAITLEEFKFQASGSSFCCLIKFVYNIFIDDGRVDSFEYHFFAMITINIFSSPVFRNHQSTFLANRYKTVAHVPAIAFCIFCKELFQFYILGICYL